MFNWHHQLVIALFRAGYQDASRALWQDILRGFYPFSFIEIANRMAALGVRA